MYFNEKTITLKDGAAAVLRSPAQSDAKSMITFLRTCTEESDFLLTEPGEFRFTEEQEAEFLAVRAEGQDAFMVVCTVGDEIAGNCGIEYNKHLKTRHRATLGITVAKKYWGMGIGRALMEASFAAAEEHGIEQLELEFIEGNDRAKALYEKLGFIITGELPDAIHLSDGSKRKLITMIKRLGNTD